MVAQNTTLALVTGACLLTPMIIMAFEQSRETKLLVVSVAVILVSLALGVLLTSRDNIIAATAAYAAVMVVYVGSATKVPDK